MIYVFIYLFYLGFSFKERNSAQPLPSSILHHLTLLHPFAFGPLRFFSRPDCGVLNDFLGALTMVWRRLGLGSFRSHQGWVLTPLRLETTQGFRLALCFSSFNSSHLHSTKLCGESPGGMQPFPKGGIHFAVELKFPQRLKLCTLAARRILLFISTYCFDVGAGHGVNFYMTFETLG